LTPQQAARILASRKLASVTPNVLDVTFQTQWDFITHPSKMKALFATRRFGKSYTAGLYLMKEALENPGCSVLYVALTRESAKGIMWKDILKILNTKHKLKIKFNETLLTATLPNGSIIYLMGADSSEDDKNKLLGRKYKLAIIDEAASFTINMRELVYGILKPAMADLAGTICLIGTPSNITRGLFYDVTTGAEPGWHLVKANTKDNPYMTTKWAHEIAELTANQPYITETPMFRQMYLGEWSVDEEKLVYRYNQERNTFKDLPKHLDPTGWSYVLGIDLGWEDDNGFVLTAYHINDPHLYVLKTFKKNHLTFDQVIEKTNEFRKHPYHSPHRFIVDGANKQGVESMRQRSSIPFEIAEKNGKVDFIEILNSDLIQGKILFGPDTQDLTEEMKALVWKTVGDAIKLPKEEHSALPNHLCDAFLYAWRLGYHYQSAPAEKKLVVGSREWYAQSADKIWERERDMIERQARGNDNSEWASEDFGGWNDQ